MPTITPFLWFDDNLEEAIELYTSIFPDTKVGKMTRYGDAGPMPKGTVMTANFELQGQSFIGLNAGPHFKFNEAVSFYVRCKNQEEVDYYWSRLTANGGEESQCGWLKDKFGLSWQIVPEALERWLSETDPAKANRAMQAMLKMKKIDVAAIERAAAGK
jgi:predicted 3-demethylubiquinone-9 3-methyltransferase (glyoxalase superfamily)